jgi:hypothetical protein
VDSARRLTENFSSMPLMAPPPLGSDIAGGVGRSSPMAAPQGLSSLSSLAPGMPAVKPRRSASVPFTSCTDAHVYGFE